MANTLKFVIATLDELPPSQWCQLLFAASSCLILAIQVLPNDLRAALANYGGRRPVAAASADDQSREKKRDDDKDSKDSNSDAVSTTASVGQQRAADNDAGLLRSALLGITSLGQVPHSWFMHFYVVSVAWSAFWLWQYLTHGEVMAALARAEVAKGGVVGGGAASMPVGRVLVAWVLMALQGSRRLYESVFVSKSGRAPMWIVHWALGVVFYTTMGLSVWIEGSREILLGWNTPTTSPILTSRMPSALALYVVACSKQNEFHAKLASLKKYTLPTGGWFDYLVCPHYLCECLIYMAIGLAAAPPGQLFNRTVLAGLFFTAINLGATAHGTKLWYAEKFGTDRVAHRWRMIPFVF